MDKIYKNKDGKIVLWQRPNLPLIVWGACTVLVWLVPAGKLEDLLRLIAFGALFTWAWLEIFTGINYFRRAAGAIVMVLTIMGHL